MIRILFAALLAATAGLAAAVHAEETTSDRATREMNDAERAAKKAGHRGAEALCAQGDAKCLEEKAKHRAQESRDYMKDKTDEAKQRANEN